MAGNIGTFDFKKLNVIFGVAHITGYADGEAVEVTEESPAFNSTGGADGYTDRIKNNANRLNITLRIRQTSPVNQVLSALHNTDRAVSTPLPIIIKDSSGTTLITAKNAWITQHPTITYGNEAQQREWIINTGSDYLINLGGNN
mgnify:CR=1 FL=1|tara:strand:+ start:132 stop:563 length:432 start_codon:yes stop_codon:yes gene_type:complete